MELKVVGTIAAVAVVVVEEEEVEKEGRGGVLSGGARDGRVVWSGVGGEVIEVLVVVVVVGEAEEEEEVVEVDCRRRLRSCRNLS